ncbi:hypothetical protein H8C13_001606 [Salmonella enterica]|nr:hypothetical protein [Salmonella enterica]
MKMFDSFKKTALVIGISAACAAPVFAADGVGPDFTSLTNSISFASTEQAVLAIAAGIIGLSLAIYGVKKLISFFGTR